MAIVCCVPVGWSFWNFAGLGEAPSPLVRPVPFKETPTLPALVVTVMIPFAAPGAVGV
jgi:hypothetical protein